MPALNGIGIHKFFAPRNRRDNYSPAVYKRPSIEFKPTNERLRRCVFRARNYFLNIQKQTPTSLVISNLNVCEFIKGARNNTF